MDLMDLDRSEGRRDSNLSRGGLRAWALWVLAGAAGGAVAAATGYLLEVFSLTILLGVTLGVMQALVVRHYLPTGAALLWALFSSFGWFFGWLFLGLTVVFLSMVGLELGSQGRSVSFAGVSGIQVSGEALLIGPAVCVVFGAFQAVVLLALRGRPFLPLAILWVGASAVAGSLAPVGGLAVIVVGAETGVGEGGGFVGLVLAPAVGMAAVSAVYGAVTGVVLGMIARRTAAREGGT